MQKNTLSLLNRKITLFGENEAYYNSLVEKTDITSNTLISISPYIEDDFVSIDIGANIGVYSMALSILSPNGFVYSIEASDETYSILNNNLVVNNFENIKAYNIAVGDKNAISLFNEIPFNRGSSFIVNNDSWLSEKVVESNQKKVNMITLDEFLENEKINKLDFIKLDVEGSEISVLNGAKKTLEKFKPIVLLEFNSFSLSVLRDLSLRKALETIIKTFDDVFLIDKTDGQLNPLKTNRDLYCFLYNNMVPTTETFDDLLCAFKGKIIPNLFQKKIIEKDRMIEDVIAEKDRIIAEKDQRIKDVIAERDRIITDKKTLIESIYNSTSWKVTLPIRKIKTLFFR